ncbi:hypothetical protein VIBNISOn1_p0044 [Vibrio nigripulchritudo SOn1]|uniref:Uncharacterized protein n=1 Tax=Vibrio nigripulchritudo SOn1 TaxID=1238450 RepID=A0AAV2VZW3_9VIBR|nr:hypothetical protein VIBNISOn1_p0044 [Vibrio nigripulchritudo SOn1]
MLAGTNILVIRFSLIEAPEIIAWLMRKAGYFPYSSDLPHCDSVLKLFHLLPRPVYFT